MSTTVKLTLKGLDEYLEKIAAVGQNIDDAATRAVHAGAEVIRDGMKAKAPVLSGKLRDNILISGPKQEGDVIAARVGLIPGVSDDDTVRYGNAQEYGTSKKAAHPFIRPTIDQDTGKARSAMRKVLKEAGVL